MAKMDELRKRLLKQEEEMKKTKDLLKKEEEASYTRLGGEAAKFLSGNISLDDFKTFAQTLGFETN